MKIKNHLLGMMAIASLLVRCNSHPKFQTSVDVVEDCKKELVAFSIISIAEYVLTSLNQKKEIFSLTAVVSVVFILADGRLLVEAECISTLMGAGVIFPKFIGNGWDGSKVSLKHALRKLRE